MDKHQACVEIADKVTAANALIPNPHMVQLWDSQATDPDTSMVAQFHTMRAARVYDCVVRDLYGYYLSFRIVE